MAAARWKMDDVSWSMTVSQNEASPMSPTTTSTVAFGFNVDQGKESSAFEEEEVVEMVSTRVI